MPSRPTRDSNEDPHMLLKTARKLIVGVIGGTVVLIGIVLGPLPFVPAIIIIPLGLAILASEFFWAKLLLRRIKRRMHQVASAVGRSSSKADSRNAPPK